MKEILAIRNVEVYLKALSLETFKKLDQSVWSSKLEALTQTHQTKKGELKERISGFMRIIEDKFGEELAKNFGDRKFDTDIQIELAVDGVPKLRDYHQLLKNLYDSFEKVKKILESSELKNQGSEHIGEKRGGRKTKRRRKKKTKRRKKRRKKKTKRRKRR
jgi:hypothetical protein